MKLKTYPTKTSHVLDDLLLPRISISSSPLTQQQQLSSSLINVLPLSRQEHIQSPVIRGTIFIAFVSSYSIRNDYRGRWYLMAFHLRVFAPANPLAPMLNQLRPYLDSTHQRATEVTLYVRTPGKIRLYLPGCRMNPRLISLMVEKHCRITLWPLLSPYQPVDVFPVNDNSASL